MSAEPKPPNLGQLQLPTDASAPASQVLSLVPELPEGLLDGLAVGPAEPGLRPVDVVMCCATDDLPAMGRIFDALHRHGCVPVAMTGVERDPRRLTESVLAAGHPRLYVVCKTNAVDGVQARRLAQAFARAGRRGRHQLLVLDLDIDRVYAAVPHIRRGADQLRKRMDDPGEGARTLQLRRAMPRAPRAVPIPDVPDAPAAPKTTAPKATAPVRAREPEPTAVDTSYAMHRRRDGVGEQHIDRLVIDIEPLPVPRPRSRLSQRPRTKRGR